MTGTLQLEQQIGAQKQREAIPNGKDSTSKLSLEWHKRTHSVASDVNALVLSIDESSKGLLQIMKSQNTALVKQKEKDLAFVLEGALSVLYVKIRELRIFGSLERIEKLLRHKRLLANYYDNSMQKSPLEELEQETKGLEPEKSQFIHVVLRNLRDIVQK